MDGDNVWCSVRAYGPRSELDRFVDLCIDPFVFANSAELWWMPDVHRLFPAYAEKARVPILQASNFREFETSDRNAYRFGFDDVARFPVEVFERLATAFPRLRFDCDCVEAMNDFMGLGWFNPPEGGEAFRQDLPVPKDYWTPNRWRKRTLAAQARHDDVVEKLLQALRAAEY